MNLTSFFDIEKNLGSFNEDLSQKNIPQIIALFDLDGVILDTEGQYTQLWDKIGLDFLQIKDFGQKIKGQTLVNIFEKHFLDTSCHSQIKNLLKDFESNMSYTYIKGAKEFVESLKKLGIKTALVTSSNQEKMENVYKKIPYFKTLFDKIFTAEMFTKGKPDPECYILGAKSFNAKIQNCIVFEDSFHGLEAGRNAGMTVVGLATTNPKTSIASLANLVIDDFSQFNVSRIFELLKVHF